VSGLPTATYSEGRGAAPPTPGAYAPPGLVSLSPPTPEIDRAALTYLLWASVIWLCTGAVSLVLLAGTASLYSVDTTSTGTAFVFAPLFYVVAVISAALSVTEVLLLRAAFHRLAPVDPRFSTPSKLALLLIIGFMIVLIGLVPVVLGAQSLSGCVANAANSTFSGNCSGLGDLVAGALLLLAGGIIAIIGYIGCLLGIWRFGTRYGNDRFKVGAVLLIFPLLNVVGAILILVASQSERTRRISPGAPGAPRV